MMNITSKIILLKMATKNIFAIVFCTYFSIQEEISKIDKLIPSRKKK